MKISAKTRYGLAAILRMAQLRPREEFVPLGRLAEDLQLSKMYLEQIFALLKQGGLVGSVKGPRGGYFLNRPPEQIKLIKVFACLEAGWFRPNEPTVKGGLSDLEAALTRAVYLPLEKALTEVLAALSLADLLAEAERDQNREYMYYL